ncbi:MAG: VanZ family protein [Microbacterium enclense]
MSNSQILTPTRVFVAAAALAVVGVLTLAPRALVRPVQERVVDVLFLVTERWGGVVLAQHSEMMLNIALFVPLGMAVTALLPSRWAPVTVLFGAAVSLSVETAQALVPGRVPDVDDIVFNTLGGAVGMVFVLALRLVALAAVRASQPVPRG